MDVETIAKGPQMLPPRYTCKGCSHLSTKDWRDYLENDETDSGTAAECEKAGRFISAYWSAGSAPPAWCPYLLKENHDAS